MSKIRKPDYIRFEAEYEDGSICYFNISTYTIQRTDSVARLIAAERQTKGEFLSFRNGPSLGRSGVSFSFAHRSRSRAMIARAISIWRSKSTSRSMIRHPFQHLRRFFRRAVEPIAFA